MTTETTDTGAKTANGQAAGGSTGIHDSPSWEERLAAARAMRQQVLEERRRSGDLKADTPIVGPKPWETADADSFDLIKSEQPQPEHDPDEEMDSEQAAAIMPLTAAIASHERSQTAEALAEEEAKPGHWRAIAFVGIGAALGLAVVLAGTTFLSNPNAAADSSFVASARGGSDDAGSAIEVAGADRSSIIALTDPEPDETIEVTAPSIAVIDEDDEREVAVASADIDQPSIDPNSVGNIGSSVSERIVPAAVQTTAPARPDANEALPSLDSLPVTRPFLVAGSTTSKDNTSQLSPMAEAPIMTEPMAPAEIGMTFAAPTDVAIAGEHQSGLLAPGGTTETAAVIQSVGSAPSVSNIRAMMAEPGLDSLPNFVDQPASRGVEFVGPTAITASLPNEAPVFVEPLAPDNTLPNVDLDVAGAPVAPVPSHVALGPIKRDPLVASWGMSIDLPEISETAPPVALEAPEPRPILQGDLSRYRVRVHVPSAVREENFLPHIEALQISGLKPDTARVNFKISQDNVRFFHPEDAPMANAVAEQIGAIARDFTDFSPKPALGTVEVWIAGTSAVAAAPKRVQRTTPSTTRRTTQRRQISPEEALRRRIARRLRQGEHL